jgi:microsomal prostaglandin-E synthase 2
VLYQYKICPFCNKVKAFLDFYGLKYTTIEVNPLSKQEIKSMQDWVEGDYKKVPICRINDQVVFDSSVIMQQLQTMLQERGALLDSHVPSLESDGNRTNWVKWVDTSLAVLLFPNITRNFPESWQAFAYIENVETFTLPQKLMNRILGPIAMWAAQGKIKKKYNIEDERSAMFDAIYQWADEVEAGQGTFQGGDSPSMADVCVFGCLRSITGLDTHTEVVNDPRILQWYKSMVAAVGESAEER